MSAALNPTSLDPARFCNGVLLFMWDRLPLNDSADIGTRKPCLEEDWFVEEAVAAGSIFLWRDRSAEESHRLLYRYARAEAHKRCEFGGRPHLLLLHQMTELLPAIATEALRVATTQMGAIHEGAGRRHRPMIGAQLARNSAE